MPTWQAISPTTELVVNPEYRTLCAIRDTGASGADRFHWSTTIPGADPPVAAGHTGELARAWALTAVAFRAYVADWRKLRRLGRVVWRVIARANYKLLRQMMRLFGLRPVRLVFERGKPIQHGFDLGALRLDVFII